MKLIDKDAALAVIDKRINQIATGITEIPLTGREKADATLEREVLGKVRSLIDSLEVKEVDLENPLGEVKIQTSMESGSLDEVILTTKYIAKKGE